MRCRLIWLRLRADVRGCGSAVAFVVAAKVNPVTGHLPPGSFFGPCDPTEREFAEDATGFPPSQFSRFRGGLWASTTPP